MATNLTVDRDGYIKIENNSTDSEIEILTHEDIDAAIEKNTSELQTKLDNIQSQVVKSDDGLLGGYTDYAVIGVGVLLLLVSIIFVYMMSHTARKESLEDLRRRYRDSADDNRDKVRELDKKIYALERRIRDMETKLDSMKTSAPARENFSAAPSHESFYTPPPPPKPSLESKYAEFVREFNALSELTGLPLKNATATFRQKYNVRSFVCTNAPMRMQSPIPPAEFGDGSNGDYWAYEIENEIFAVVPKIKTYTANHHIERAMGEVFNSNFATGNTYNKIRVVKPAIFKGMWTLETKGQLELG